MARKKPAPQAIIEVANPESKLVPLEEQLLEPEVVIPEVQEKPKGRARLGIGKFVLNLMKTCPEFTNAQLLEAVAHNFPEAETTKACIAWYRTKYRQDQAKAQLAETKVEVQAETVEA